jgi:glycosyltransferase involved in cell wall biosynthesis
MDVTVVVATFGGDEWPQLAHDRAVPSAIALDVPVITAHAGSLHDARNLGLEDVQTEWVCFLDADDELTDGYFDAMAQGVADVRAPSVSYVRDGRPQAPYVPNVAGHHHDCEAGCLMEGNWLVVGSVARADLIREVGGWRDFPVYEDFDLWLRCYLAGASIEAIPEAVYRAHVRPDSRNRAPSQQVKHATHRAIALANGVPAPA